MANLIDRDNLIDVLDEVVNDYRMEEDFDSAFAVEYAIGKVKKQTPADTERHAHWIKDRFGYHICSNCMADSPHDIDSLDDYGIKTKYCNECGAIMDEVIK